MFQTILILEKCECYLKYNVLLLEEYDWTIKMIILFLSVISKPPICRKITNELPI